MNNIQSFIVKNKNIFIGLEDSKKTWKLCVRSNNLIVNEPSMPAEYSALKGYLENNFQDCKILIMYEAGFRGFELHDQLQKDEYNCIVTPPHTVTEEKCQRRKNDRIDARRLAKNLENGDYHSCYIPSRKLREDRQVSRLYAQIQRDANRVCNRIRRTLEFHGLDRFFKSGNWSRAMYKQVYERIATMELSPSIMLTFEMYFNELNYLREIQKRTLKELHALAKEEPYQRTVEILKSAPGVGLLTAIRLTLEWGDLKRFKRKEDFCSFLGLIPDERSSGEQERKGHITKQGNRHVRAWLIESAWRAIRHDPVLLDKFNRVVNNSGSRKKAIVAVARKLANRLRTLILNDTFYEVALVK